MKTAQDLIRSIEEDKISMLTTEDFKLEFTKKELNEYVHFCIVSKSLESVEIKDIDFNPVIEEVLGRALPLNNSVKKLELNNLRSFDEAGGSLKELLQFNTCIEELVIANNSKINEVLSYISPNLEANIEIKKLGIISSSLNDDGIIVLSDIIKNNTSFNEIDLSHQPLDGKSLPELFKIINKKENILSLGLSHTQCTLITADNLSRELEDNEYLLNLDLSFNSFAKSLPWSFFQFLNSKSKLLNLNLKNCDLNCFCASNLARTFSNNPQFESIDLSDNNMRDLGVTIISRYAKELNCLTSLDLRNNNTTKLAPHLVQETLEGIVTYQI